MKIYEYQSSMTLVQNHPDSIFLNFVSSITPILTYPQHSCERYWTNGPLVRAMTTAWLPLRTCQLVNFLEFRHSNMRPHLMAFKFAYGMHSAAAASTFTKILCITKFLNNSIISPLHSIEYAANL